MNVILASNSPRRRELLLRENIEFKVIPSNFNEPKNFGLTPSAYVEYLAYNKAKSVFDTHGGVVIGADTVVVLDSEILGKPINESDAICMLRKLSGKTHEVITGYSVVSKDKTVTSHEVTKVTFNELSTNVILNYVKTGSPLDKAGAYGIQDGDFLVKEIIGDKANVVGLPVKAVKKVLLEFI